MKKYEKKKRTFKNKYDYHLLFCVILTSLLGLIAIASATKSLDTPRYIIVQSATCLIGFAIIFFGMKLNIDFITKFSKYIIGANAAILILVLFIGQGGEEVGTKGWIRIGSLGIQPSEIIKVTFVLTYAWHIDMVKESINKPKTLALLLLHAFAIIFLILLQPDMGTAMVFLTITVVMLYFGGLSVKYIIGAVASLAVILPAIWFFVLKEFQKNRVFSFLNPEADPLGSGYHVTQSKLAIGSGQIWGQGLFSGTQTQYGHLPEKQTDFVFAVIGEELGFIGCIVVFVLLITIIVKCFQTAKKCSDLKSELICCGIGAMFLFHTFENIGMCLGLLPVTGIPLPFISYGGSNMLTSMLAVMLVLNIRNNVSKEPIKKSA